MTIALSYCNTVLEILYWTLLSLSLPFSLSQQHSLDHSMTYRSAAAGATWSFPCGFSQQDSAGICWFVFLHWAPALFLLLPRDWERNRKAKQSWRRAVAKAMELSQECGGKMLSDKVPLWTFLLMELQIISNLSTLQTRLAADQVTLALLRARSPSAADGHITLGDLGTAQRKRKSSGLVWERGRD